MPRLASSRAGDRHRQRVGDALDRGGPLVQRTHLKHVRTRHKAPETNGVVERWFESLKYGRLYRRDIDDGLVLGEHVADFLDEFDRLRPHERSTGNDP